MSKVLTRTLLKFSKDKTNHFQSNLRTLSSVGLCAKMSTALTRTLLKCLLQNPTSAQVQCRKKITMTAGESLHEFLQRGQVSNGRIHAKYPVIVKEKLEKIILEGNSKLQVISDFDYTLTKAYANGERGLTCYGIIEKSTKVTQEFRDETRRLLHQFYPIEVDPHMSSEEKIPHMIEWYNGAHEALKKCDLYQKDFEEMVFESDIHLRDGADLFVDTTFRRNIPFLVFSAGTGDIVDACLRRYGVKPKNTHVISNFANFSPDGKLIGYEKTLIHMFNKNEHAIAATGYFGEIKARNNVLLLGDSLGDVQMSEGVQNPGVVLKIGFLNDKGRGTSHDAKKIADGVEDRLQKFMDEFDVVLVNDQTFEIPLEILNNVIAE